MSEEKQTEIGSIIWIDLTVDQAEDVRDFYAEVVGWEFDPVDMGGYNDFNMLSPGSEEASAGICFRRGMNADLPPLWLVYISVADLEESIHQCEKLGGRVVSGPKGEPGTGRYCVIQDPAGAVAALFQPGEVKQEG